MFRVTFAILSCVTLASCTASRSIETASLAEGSASTAPPRVGARPAGHGAATGSQVASLADPSSTSSFAKAPVGALADRDYSGAKLEPDRALAAINAYRREHGLKSLTLDPLLTLAAKEHSRDLAKWDRISHYGSDGSTPWDRVKRTGYRPKVAAENVGTGQASLDEVIKGWRESESHNKNLLMSDATQIGIALVQDPKSEFKTFWTLVLGAPM